MRRVKSRPDYSVEEIEPRGGAVLQPVAPDLHFPDAFCLGDARAGGMVSLFSSSRKRRRDSESQDTEARAETRSGAGTKGDEEGATACDELEEAGVDDNASKASFESLQLAPWVLKACSTMGFRHPTPVQARCIPSILEGRDVLGCAETGSGKTAAFALPMLHRLSEDPYGVFGVVMTPTRELAIQIAEQFQALGAAINLRHCVIIGGMSMVQQSVELNRRPHIIIATPGRLRDHLQSASPPDLSKARFLVLDEADRLFCDGFEKDLACILRAMPPSRQTLLFSATMTASLEELKTLTRTKPVLFDLTKDRTMPASLQQQYLFMPAQVKMCYLIEVLQKLGEKGLVIVFVGSCQRCQEINEVLLESGLSSVCLHSVMSQSRRLAALGKFKSSLARILVSTDVASRGLDIPDVDLVINFDLPRVAVDYVHRVGRTARAGKFGRAISLVTQFDVELVHSIETFTKSRLELCEEIKEEDVVKLLNPVSKATRAAKMRLMELGFDEKIAERQSRKKHAKKMQHKAKKQRAKDAAT